jgi:hypothetical protein
MVRLGHAFWHCVNSCRRLHWHVGLVHCKHATPDCRSLHYPNLCLIDAVVTDVALSFLV